MAIWDTVLDFIRGIFGRRGPQPPSPPHPPRPPQPPAPVRPPEVPAPRRYVGLAPPEILPPEERPAHWPTRPELEVSRDPQRNLRNLEAFYPGWTRQEIGEVAEFLPEMRGYVRMAEITMDWTGQSWEELWEPGSPFWMMAVGLELETLEGASRVWWQRGWDSWFVTWLEYLGLSDEEIQFYLEGGRYD